MQATGKRGGGGNLGRGRRQGQLLSAAQSKMILKSSWLSPLTASFPWTGRERERASTERWRCCSVKLTVLEAVALNVDGVEAKQPVSWRRQLNGYIPIWVPNTTTWAGRGSTPTFTCWTFQGKAHPCFVFVGVLCERYTLFDFFFVHFLPFFFFFFFLFFFFFFFLKEGVYEHFKINYSKKPRRLGSGQSVPAPPKKKK